MSPTNDDDNKWLYWMPEIYSDLFAPRIFHPLPPRDEALSLLKIYFRDFNSHIPLFHEPSFMPFFERQYSGDPYEGAGWWASINVALAISHRSKALGPHAPEEENKEAWYFLKNAMGVLTELTLRNNGLWGVQALLGMVRRRHFIGSGDRLCNANGLSRRCSFKEHQIPSQHFSWSQPPFAWPNPWDYTSQTPMALSWLLWSLNSEDVSSGLPIFLTRSAFSRGRLSNDNR